MASKREKLLAALRDSGISPAEACAILAEGEEDNYSSADPRSPLHPTNRADYTGPPMDRYTAAAMRDGDAERTAAADSVFGGAGRSGKDPRAKRPAKRGVAFEGDTGLNRFWDGEEGPARDNQYS